MASDQTVPVAYTGLEFPGESTEVKPGIQDANAIENTIETACKESEQHKEDLNWMMPLPLNPPKPAPSNRIRSLIQKAEMKRYSKRKIRHWLKTTGADEDDITKAYCEYYKENGLYECIFKQRPIDFSLIMDMDGGNAIVSAIQDNRNRKVPLKIGSIIYDIHGRRVDDTKYEDTLKLLAQQPTPFYVVSRRCVIICIHTIWLLAKNSNVQNEKAAERVKNHRLVKGYRIVSIKWWIESFIDDHIVLSMDIEWILEIIGPILMKITGFTEESAKVSVNGWFKSL